MRLIYVAGPYRAPCEWQVLQNIRRAEAMAIEVWLMGAACICPHKNTAFFGGAAADSVWLEGDLEIVRRCDAIICVEGWELSAGSRGEVELARTLGKPVFQTLAELQSWLKAAMPEARHS
jgi:uncharacterized protein DUF4406